MENARRIVSDKYLLKKIRCLRKSAKKSRHDSRPGKQRYGLYRYLRDVYGVYLELRSRRTAKKATCRIAKILHLPRRQNSHPIRILIEASAGPEDNRQKSRWTQALRYAFGWRLAPGRLSWCFSVNGGIAGAASKYAALRKAHRTARKAKTAKTSGGTA